MVAVRAEESPQLRRPDRERTYRFRDDDGTVRNVRVVALDERGGTDVSSKEEVEEGGDRAPRSPNYDDDDDDDCGGEPTTKGDTDAAESSADAAESSADAEQRRTTPLGGRRRRDDARLAAVREILATTALLSSVSLLRVFEAEATCGDDHDVVDEEDENGCVRRMLLGFRPSSLLTAAQTLTGAIVAIATPLFLKFFLNSRSRRRRRSVATATGAVTIAWTYASVALTSTRDWSALGTCWIVCGAVYFFHTLSTHSALSELSLKSEEADAYQRASKRARAASFLTTLFFFGGARLYHHFFSDATGVDYEIASTKAFFASSAATTTILFALSWRSFGDADRDELLFDATKEEDDDDSASPAWTMLGPREAILTFVFLWNERRPLFWYLIALLLYTSILATMGGVGLTYLVSVLRTDFAHVAIGGVVFVLGAVVGDRANVVVADWFDVLRAHKLLTVLWTYGLIYIGLCLTGPGQIAAYQIANGVLGLCLGWTGRCARDLHAALLPPEHADTETTSTTTTTESFTGAYATTCASGFWILPFATTALNEFGVPMNVTILLGTIPMLGCFFALHMIGPLDDATATATATDSAAVEKSRTTPFDGTATRELVLLLYPSRGTIFFFFEPFLRDCSRDQPSPSSSPSSSSPSSSSSPYCSLGDTSASSGDVV